MLSPAGTAEVQWTSDAGAAAGLAPAVGVDEALGVDAEGAALVCVAGDEPLHAASASSETRAAPRTRTR